jgi:hypothetical protein
MPGLGRSQLATESDVRSPQSAPKDQRPAVAGAVGDQPVCGRNATEAPHSAPVEAATPGDWAWGMLERLLSRLETWDVQRPTRGELMTYAREGLYTAPTVITKDARKQMTPWRRLGIAYAWLFSRNIHSLVYAALWVLRQPSRATAKVRRPTLEQLFDGAENSSGPAQWVNCALLAVHTAAYAALWVTERPSRAIAAGGTISLHLALSAAGL